MYSWQVNMFHSLQGEDLERFPRNEDVLSSSGFYMHNRIHHHRRKREMCKAFTCISGIDYLNCHPNWLTQTLLWFNFQTYPFNEFNVSLVNSTNTDHLLWTPHCTRNWPCKDDLDVDLPVSRLQWGKRYKSDFSVDYFSSPCHFLSASSFSKTPSF